MYELTKLIERFLYLWQTNVCFQLYKIMLFICFQKLMRTYIYDVSITPTIGRVKDSSNIGFTSIQPKPIQLHLKSHKSPINTNHTKA